jgi:hypothetical protein
MTTDNARKEADNARPDNDSRSVSKGGEGVEMDKDSLSRYTDDGAR